MWLVTFATAWGATHGGHVSDVTLYTACCELTQAFALLCSFALNVTSET